MNLVVCGWDFNEEVKEEIEKINKEYHFDKDRFEALQTKFVEVSQDQIDSTFFTSENNLENFNYQYQEEVDFGKVIFSYNNNLDLYLIAYLITDNNGIAYLYEHKFRLVSEQVFNNTLVSNVYSIIGSDEVLSEYNEHINGGLIVPPDSLPFFREL